MKKLLIWGDSPTIPTGFSNAISYIIKYLPQDQYEVVVLGVNYNGSEHDLPYEIYQANINAGDIFGLTVINDVIKKENPDIVFILNDIWVISLMLNVIDTTAKKVVYFPVDAEDHDPEWYKCLDKVDAAIVYNDFGLEVASKAKPDFKFHVIGHGVDTDTFYRAHDTRREAKELLFASPELHDSFIILNAGRNQPRKRLDITMRAFQKFAADKDDVFLYMHSGIKDLHIDTVRLAKELGIYDKLILTGMLEGPQRVPQEHLNMIYNVCDVGINTGLGEGFGLPNAEHAATGAPQIVPNHSALTKLYQDCGLLMPANIPFTLDQISTTAKMVEISEVVKAMNELYWNKETYTKLSKLCYDKFNTESYSWENIVEEWDNLFRKLTPPL
jgi:glycosyltransferase involved in cell wall biosynthesis